MGNPSIDYTDRDEASIKAGMIKRIPFSTPEWTDHNDNDLGIAIMDEMAVADSVLHYYIDKAAREGFPGSCDKRESLEKHYFFWNIPGATPATVKLLFAILASFKQDVSIPAKTQCQTPSAISPVFFETDSLLTLKYALLTANTNGTDIINCVTTGFVAGQLVEINDDVGTAIQRTILAVLPGNQLQMTSVVPSGYTTGNNAYVSALNGEVGATEGKTTDETLNNSDGTAFQKFRSISKRIIDGTLSLVIDEGGGDVTWTAKETFYESGPTDTHFIWKRKWDDTVIAIIGDGAQGKIPVTSSTMRFNFRAGGGIYGKVGIGTIKQLNDQILVGGQPISISVTNLLAATGGADRMDLETAKVRGPEILRTNDRYVSSPDYIAGAKSVSGVGNANVVRVTAPGVTYNLAVYIIPTGGGLPSAALKAAVKAELSPNYKGTVRVNPEVFDPGLARIMLGGTIHVFSNYIQAIVKAAVETALAAFFAVNNLEFGKAIRESDIIAVIETVDGVDYLDITKLTLFIKGSDVDLTRWTGNAYFSDITIGANVVAEVWTVTFLTPTTFNVRGSVSGLQGNGSLGVQFSSSNGDVTFTISAGANPMVTGDNASFRTAAFRENVDVLEDEIAMLETNELAYSGGG